MKSSSRVYNSRGKNKASLKSLKRKLDKDYQSDLEQANAPARRGEPGSNPSTRAVSRMDASAGEVCPGGPKTPGTAAASAGAVPLPFLARVQI